MPRKARLQAICKAGNLQSRLIGNLRGIIVKMHVPIGLLEARVTNPDSSTKKRQGCCKQVRCGNPAY
jgi:hypothetical protein